MIDVLKTQLGSSLDTVRRFLQRPISVHQGGVTLSCPADGARAQARDDRRMRVRRMRRDLYELMGQHPNSRQLMRHLDLVERTLRRDGLSGVEALPVRVITKALTQLEQLVWDWSSPGLAELRSRMAVIVRSRPALTAAEAAREAEREAATTEALALEMTTHTIAHDAEIDDDELAAFAEMERSWAGRQPEAVAAAAANQTGAA